MLAMASLTVGLNLLSLLGLAASRDRPDPCLAPAKDFPDNNHVGIETQADIDLIINCTTITWSLMIMYNSTIQGTISLPNVVSLYGFDIIWDTSATAISFPRLTTVTKNLWLKTNTITTLDLPLLSDVGDSLNINLPALSSWSGMETLRTVYRFMIPHHNISSLSFPNLTSVVEASFNFSSSGGSLYLGGTASPAVLVTGNGDTNFTSDLQKMGTTRVRGCNVTHINAVSASSLEIAENVNLEEFHVPNLISLGPYVEAINYPRESYAEIYEIKDIPEASYHDVLLIAENPGLQYWGFPNLTTIHGTFELINNDGLFLFEGLPMLETVSGNITMVGNMGSIVHIRFFPALVSVGGNMNITSTFLDVCDYFTSLFNNGCLKGNLYCKARGPQTVNLIHMTPSPTPAASKQKSRFDKSKMIGIGFGVVICGFAISSVIAIWIIKLRRW